MEARELEVGGLAILQPPAYQTSPMILLLARASALV